ncbi:MAG TPA: hypothetical protein VN734_08965 [Acidobacteriaceae bacterium]|nr:hypothetical protein [Acidobacteriaceae bacterium]
MQSLRWGLLGMLALAQLALLGCTVPAITIPSNLLNADASRRKPRSGDTSASSPSTPTMGTVVGVTASTIVAGTGLTDSGATTLACGTTPGQYSVQALDNDLPDSATSGQRVVAGLQSSTTYYCQLTYSTGAAPLTFTSHTAEPLPSTPITGLSFGTVSSYNAINAANQMNGDTFYNCKSSDGSTYLTTDDTYGWQQSGNPTSFYSALSLVKFTSENPLAGITVNQFQNYGKGGSATSTDGRSEKDAGLFCMDGKLYMLVGRQLNQATGGMGTNTAYVQDAGQMIVSNDHGATWNNFQSPSTFNPQGSPTSPIDATMFPGLPGNFGSATFVMYCQDNGSLGYMDTCNLSDNATAYVYLMANDGYWNNGNVLYLARVPRAKMSRLQPSDYQFFIGGDGINDASWTTDETKAQPVLSSPGKLSEPNVQYIPTLNRYLMLTYSYPDGLTPPAPASQHTLWQAYESPHPWGPWTLINTTDWPTQGYYNPVILNDTAGNLAPTIMFTNNFMQWPNYTMYTTTLNIQH